MLWTDILDPVEATGFARAEQEAYEQSKGTLARFLPNVEVPDIYVEFVVGDNGLVDEAFYRAYDAEPEIGRGGPLQTVTLKLPAISRNEPIDERTQLALRRLSDDQIRKGIQAAIRRSVWAISDRSERMRGTVLDTGIASAVQHNFKIADDFGRDAALTFSASTLWSTAAVDRISALETWADLYAAKNNGIRPQRIVGGGQAIAALLNGSQFATVLPGGATLNGGIEQVNTVLAGRGLPTVERNDRQTSGGYVIRQDRLLFLPAPGDTAAEEASPLGATFWGQTLTADLPEYGIEPAEQPGIVVGVYREDRVPAIVEVMADSVSMPVLGNANLSMSVEVI